MVNCSGDYHHRALWRSGYRDRLEICFPRERRFESCQRRFLHSVSYDQGEGGHDLFDSVGVSAQAVSFFLIVDSVLCPWDHPPLTLWPHLSQTICQSFAFSSIHVTICCCFQG